MAISGFITACAAGGTLCALMAIALAEGFFGTIPNIAVLSIGEWEMLSVVLYVIAIILYIGGSSSGPRGRRSPYDDTR